jgi:hypothetical protein
MNKNILLFIASMAMSMASLCTSNPKSLNIKANSKKKLAFLLSGTIVPFAALLVYSLNRDIDNKSFVGCFCAASILSLACHSIEACSNNETNQICINISSKELTHV